MDAHFKRGDTVRVKSRPDWVGMVSGDPSRSAGEIWYPVFFGPGRVGRHPETDLELYELTSDIHQLFIDQRFASRDAFSKLYTHLRLVTSLKSQIYSIGASRTYFYPYQFKPLLKFLDSRNHRILIADEVGMGKTIETGIVLTELRKRRDPKRILIVPPAHLVTKWRAEMKNRFDLEFSILDKKSLIDFFTRYQQEGDETMVHGIVSLQTLRARSVLEAWETITPSIDIVVFDEAGRLRNSGTLSQRVASLVLESADAALLLTATPVQTGSEDLFNLLRLLEPEEFDDMEVFKWRLEANAPVLEAEHTLRAFPNDTSKCLSALKNVENSRLRTRFTDNPLYLDICDRLSSTEKPLGQQLVELQRDINGLSVFSHIVNRTRKREVQEHRPERSAVVVPVDATASEKGFYDLVTEICRRAYSRWDSETVSAFVATTRQRQVASCMVAMLDYFDQAGLIDDLEELSDLRKEDYDSLSEDSVVAGLPEDDKQRKDIVSWRESLWQEDSKYGALFGLLKRLDREEPGRKIVLFSYFKRTLSYLQKRLTEASYKCELISGDIPSNPGDPDKDERGKRLDNFQNNPNVRILLSTEVGSEGIDLQFAHILINYDLPWNPMVVEQRIGRIDRIGQKADKILIYNLSMKGTIEDKILQRLYNRIGIFRESIGDLETILGEEIRQMTKDLFSRHLSAEEQEKRIEQVAQAIINKQLDMERFEAASSALLGHDEFFIDQIELAKKQKRYISGEELVIYSRDFLKEHYRTCRIEPIVENDTYTLTMDSELRNFIRGRVPAEDHELRLFLNRSSRGTLRFTINPETAQQDAKMEFMTFHHPLIRAITTHYNEHLDELHPVSHIRLRWNGINPGFYAWFMYVIEISGARPTKDLTIVILQTTPVMPLIEDNGNAFFNEMVLRSEIIPPSERGRLPLDTADLIAQADETLAVRLKARFEQMSKYNEALVSNRLASLEESHNRIFTKRSERLEKAIIEKKKATYIKGLETSIRNLTAAFEDKKSEIQALRRIGKSFDLKGAGIVEVSDE